MTVSVSCFVPRPFTPFQWEAQDSIAALERKQQLPATPSARAKSHHYHDAHVSYIKPCSRAAHRGFFPRHPQAVDRGQRHGRLGRGFFPLRHLDGSLRRRGHRPRFLRRPPPSVYGAAAVGPHRLRRQPRVLVRGNPKGAREALRRPIAAPKCAGCGANRLGGTRSCCP